MLSGRGLQHSYFIKLGCLDDDFVTRLHGQIIHIANWAMQIRKSPGLVWSAHPEPMHPTSFHDTNSSQKSGYKAYQQY